ncbi:hypothetical protein [Flavobacterium sp. T12S277]|uniref:hypothetical protein n=1 Tax=Flavobacterium sp. T12S277 TaxID=3402752 RepID=UPI003AE006EF
MKINFTVFISTIFSFASLISCQNDSSDDVANVPSEKEVKSDEIFLAKDLAIKYIADADEKEKSNSKTKLKSSWDAREFSYNGKKLKFKTNVYGNKPSDGRSLYISMHGGGLTTATANDEQWSNQISMTGNNAQNYNIKEGVVIVPRAPVDDWNMWFQSEIDNLFEDAIRAAVLFADVNPNKVYIMGYSAGGDGTFRLATRMADHWAAASMSAGHPGECTPANLRNIGFALNMGGLDSSYNRNILAREWKTKLDNLALADPAGYKHMVNIFDDKPHWMDMEDRIAVPFMASFKRQPYPDKIVWEQNSFHIRQYFYWVGISEADTKVKEISDNPTKTIKISYAGNIINIEENYADELFIYLNDKMLDLDKEVVVNYKGNSIFAGKVKRSTTVITQTAAERKDGDYIFSARLVVSKNKKVIVTN